MGRRRIKKSTIISLILPSLLNTSKAYMNIKKANRTHITLGVQKTTSFVVDFTLDPPVNKYY